MTFNDRQSMHEARSKVNTLDELAAIADEARRNGLKIVLAHGVFDLTHMATCGTWRRPGARAIC